MPPSAHGAVRAPDFPGGLDWLNTPGPLSLRELRGRFVLLDFWAYCCINCLHAVPELKRLEAKYARELLVIGVHSAKFPNESRTDGVRNAAMRLGIEHPVVNDPDRIVWSQYAVRAWPTFVLVDPRGYVVWQHSGEGFLEPLEELLRELVPRFEGQGLLDRRPLEAPRERRPEGPLAFPGKLFVSPRARRIFIADSGHHRILVTDLKGRFKQQIGSGQPGLADGDLESARFRNPQGLFYDRGDKVLYVADADNHAVRRVDLGRGEVVTFAGNGAQAPPGIRSAAGPHSELNSPWDVLLHQERLYVAMAGPHQIWAFDPATGQGEVYAGSGREGLVDGPRLDAQLAQPSGLATDGVYLYFADSEASAVRRVPFGGDHVRVETLVGEGLFAFGDVDGARPEARLQHPLGVAFSIDEMMLYVADSYNHKIKQLYPGTRHVATLLGAGAPGRADGPRAEARFDEPGGLAFADDRLWVADTNNHRICVVDLRTATARTLDVTGAADAPAEAPPPEAEPVRLPAQTLAPGRGELQVEILLPPGFEPNPDAPGALTVAVGDEAVARMGPPETPWRPGEPLRLPLTAAAGETVLQIGGTVYFCEADGGRCHMEPVRVEVPLSVRPDAPAREALVHIAVPGRV